MTLKPLLRLTVFAAGALLCSGQSVDGTLTGSVEDPSGATVPSAKVIATNEATGVPYVATTTAEGEYRLDHIPVGTYEVKAEKDGFSPITISKVAVDLSRVTTLPLGLALASATASSVTVEASVGLDESTAQVQTAFDISGITGYPTAATGSGVINLSLLTAGVASPGGLGVGIGPSVGGQRPQGNRFYLEGADNNSYFSPGPLGTISNEAVAEFTLLQNHFSPEFGGASGGVFNTVVRTGGNAVHGSLYEYNQNRDFDALDAQFSRQKLTSPPRNDSNRLGGTIGGPIVKNKIFYFASFEYNPMGQAYAAGQTLLSPTASGYQMLNAIPGLSKTNLQVFQQYVPAAATASSTITVANMSIPIGSFPVVSPVYNNAYRSVGSLDWDVNTTDRVRGRYLYSGLSGIDTSAVLPTFFVTRPANANFISLSEYHTFTASMLNELRVGYSRSDQRETASNFIFPGLNAFPTLFIDELNLQVGPSPTVPSGTLQGDLQGSDMLTYVAGRHALKVGYQFSDLIMTTSFVSYARGMYDYSTLDTYLQDLSPDTAAARYLGTTGINNTGWPTGFLQNAAYFNDDFRVLPNLTLNLGVRYEYVTVPVMSRAQDLSAIANVPGVITFNEPQPSKTDWSPRLGFAWSPGANSPWSVRGGFSRAFDMPFTNIAANTQPAFYGSQVTNPIVPPTDFLANGGITGTSGILSSVSAARANTTGYTPDQNRPYAINYTLAVERRIGKDYLLEARYLGSRGDHLLIQTELNAVAPVTPTQYLPTFLTQPTAAQLAPLTLNLQTLKNIAINPLLSYGFTKTITAYEPIGNSQYHALALQATRRYSRNLSFIAAYTWSHLMDDSTATVNSTLLTPRRPQDFGDIRADWSNSMLDRRQRFTFSPVIDIAPFGNGSRWLREGLGNWNVSFTYTYESPAYVTVQSGVDSNLNGDSAADRAIVNPAGNPLIGSGVNGIDANGNVTTVASAIVAYVAKNSNAGYIVAGAGALANGGRNTFPLDPINNFDVSIKKRFAVGERVKVEVGFQAFNLLNHPQFTSGYTDDVAQTKNSNRNFLIPSNAAFGQYGGFAPGQGFFPSNSRYGQVMAKVTF
jgi:hypothetical protein